MRKTIELHSIRMELGGTVKLREIRLQKIETQEQLIRLKIELALT